MRLNCGPSLAQRRWDKRIKMQDWHKHFCWRPVRLGENDCRWLETVERKYAYWRSYYGLFPEYREITR